MSNVSYCTNVTATAEKKTLQIVKKTFFCNIQHLLEVKFIELLRMNGMFKMWKKRLRKMTGIQSDIHQPFSYMG